MPSQRPRCALPDPPHELFRRVQDDPPDQPGWAAVCTYHTASEPELERWLRGRGFPAGVAQAAASIAVDRIIDALRDRRCRHVSDWLGYIKSIARNAAVTVLRRRRRRYVSLDQVALEAPVRCESAGLLADVADAFASLREADRRLLVLLAVEERTQAEVGAMYGLAQGTVCRRLQAAVRRLREEVLPTLRRE